MFILTTIGLLISTVFLSFGLSLGGSFLAPREINSTRGGMVLGANEYQPDNIIQGGDFNEAITKVFEDVKFLSLSQIPQFNQIEQELPQIQEKDELPTRIINFDLAAENGVILDSQSNNLFFSKRPDRAWPLASITKLFTAYTFLDHNPGWETIYEIKTEDRREGGKIYLFTGDKVKIKDLFYFSLVGSDNTATAALANSTGMTEEEFIVKINNKIEEFGLKNTKIVDVAGLKEGNVSTAREIAQFADVALEVPEINRAVLTEKYEFTTEQGRKKVIYSTDKLLNNFSEQDISILGGKTGHIDASGYNLVSKFMDQEGRTITTVILGADSEASRFILTQELVELYYNNRP